MRLRWLCLWNLMGFQKAFNTVDHRILLKKLEHYGIRRNSKECFPSDLHDKKQFDLING